MPVNISSKRLHSEFVNKIKDISGQNLYLCYQCGLCSGNCPMAANMDLSPRQIIELARLGLEEEIADSKTVWTCASCLTCTVNCPRGFDLSKIMEAIRLLTLRENVDYISPEDISPEERGELPQIAFVSALRKFTG
ncbi:MAG: 4Fe-4S dicluster domain-containing protein [Chloroflexota bacterium]|nr:4Fe-4S dicluster domain-containing protein [Chloroflexota bacterium]